MGGCCGCFRQPDDLNEINQDDILWLKTPSSLTTGTPSIVHFSIGGLSNMSSQEPAVVTIARKAQEKADQEKAKLEASKNNVVTSEAATEASGAKQGDSENKNDNAKKEEPITSKAESQEPITSKAESPEPIKSKAESQEPITSKAESPEPIKSKAESTEPITSKAESQEPITSKAESEEPITSKAESQEPIKSNAEVQHEVEVEKAKLVAEVEASKAKIEDVLQSETTAEVQHEVDVEKAKVLAEVEASKAKIEFVDHAEEETNEIGKEIEPQADVINEADVTIEIEADVINKPQSDVTNEDHSSIPTKSSQVSTTIEMGAQEHPVEHPPESGDEAEPGAVDPQSENLPEEPVAMETGDVNDEVADEEEEMSWVDMSFSQPLMPQQSEVVRVGIIARVPFDDTEASNDVTAPAGNGEGDDGEGGKGAENAGT